ncbi:hypothetical protein LRS10_21960 [Phenylobacterium sp. J426]|uniref:hypothetical protein n=1 Tax=Phenylobacterium sp. J426 TaxID=2898439 RepID=UPI002150857B|nr:hypothetical protein [Phenylobacterium sp. J426]MCR5876577.1 hypothetical protein [Phenylobacterium sp. J426]
MAQIWKAERCEFGWHVVRQVAHGVSAPYSLVVGGLVQTPFFETRHEAEHFADQLEKENKSR